MSAFTQANGAVQALLDGWVAEGTEIGIHVIAYAGEDLVVDAWAGMQDAAAGVPVDPATTLFNVFSVTKAVTAIAVQLQAERGLIDCDAPLARYWPEFETGGRERVTVRHVLTHRSGLHALPADITVAQMCDWDWMTAWLGRATPAFEPGSRSAYQSMTFGWLLGELVRRTDPARRPFGRFVMEEIGLPLGAPDLHIGLPEAFDARVAVMDGTAIQVIPEGTEYRTTNPIQLDLMPEPFGRPAVRRATIPAVGGIFGARSAGRFWAMLANGGTLGGVRLLSAARTEGLGTPRENFEEPESVFFGMHVPMSASGLWLGGPYPPVCAPRNDRALCHPGMGGSIGWADPQRSLAVALCHNRLFDAMTPEDDHRTAVGDAIRDALGLA